MTAPVCPSLPVYRPSIGSGTESTQSGGAQSPQTTSTTGTLVGGSLLRISQNSGAPVSAPVSAPTTDLIRSVFNVHPSTGTWIERAGRTTRGTRPPWLDWPMHTAAEMGPPVVAYAELAKQSKGRRA